MQELRATHSRRGAASYWQRLSAIVLCCMQKGYSQKAHMSMMEWNNHRYLYDAFTMILQEAKLRNAFPYTWDATSRCDPLGL